MKVKSIKTHKITKKDESIFLILATYLPRLKEGTVVAVTSKIVSICEGSMVEYASENLGFKEKIIKEEAELYVPRTSNKYNVLLTIKGGAMSFSSGVDESNAKGHLILWPRNPQKSANEIREYLAKKYHLKRLGVIITDTASVPLRWGQRGVFVLAHSGFLPLNSYIGKPDIFGRKLKMTSAAIADALGTAAVLVMGEGNEQTPLAIIEDVSFVHFQNRNPTKKELAKLRMPLEDDLYAPLLTAVKWQKGGAAKLDRYNV